MNESTYILNFFTEFAQAFNLNNPKKAAEFCGLPIMIIADSSKKVVSTKAQLHALYASFTSTFQERGILKYVPQVNQTMALSDTLFFTNITWKMFDKEGQLILVTSSSYTLQKMASGELKIIINVIDDKQKKLEHLFPASQSLA